MKFGLTEGMDKQEIVAEMLGRTSGETRLQVMNVLLPREERKVGLKIKHRVLRTYDRILKVVKANERYAVIYEKITLWRRKLGKSEEELYYLAGISDDEDKYFLHRLETSETEIFAKAVAKPYYTAVRDMKLTTTGVRSNRQVVQLPTVEQLAEYVDRKDQDFVRRVQGDLLIQFLPIKRIKHKLGDGNFTTLCEYVDLPNNRRQTVHWHLPNQMNRLEIGRHQITVWPIQRMLPDDGLCGIVFVSRPNREDYLFGGGSISIQHPEHKSVGVIIPHDHVALIAQQRGATPSSRMLDSD